MRAAILFILLAACFDERDAREMVRSQNRPEPIHCMRTSQTGTQVITVACTDGDGWAWLCNSNGCIITWRPQ